MVRGQVVGSEPLGRAVPEPGRGCGRPRTAPGPGVAVRSPGRARGSAGSGRRGGGVLREAPSAGTAGGWQRPFPHPALCPRLALGTRVPLSAPACFAEVPVGALEIASLTAGGNSSVLSRPLRFPAEQVCSTRNWRGNWEVESKSVPAPSEPARTGVAAAIRAELQAEYHCKIIVSQEQETCASEDSNDASAECWAGCPHPWLEHHGGRMRQKLLHTLRTRSRRVPAAAG